VATVKLRPRFARRSIDPFTSAAQAIERNVFFVPVTDLPSGIPTAAGVKPPKTRWDVYRDVQASLLDKSGTPGLFHLKNRGLTLVARDVRKIEEDEYDIDLGPGHGILDGGNTYRLIIETQQNPDVVLPKKQFVKVEILTRVPDEWLPEMGNGLNTPMLSYGDSLLPLQDALAWIKDELKGESYFKAIAWSESERAPHDARDILALLTCFNVTSYQNTGATHPVAAYDSRGVVLSSFEQDYKQRSGSYERLRPILKDVLVLHDTIQLEFPKLLERGGARFNEVVERAPKRPHEFVFLGTRSTERLAKGALLPVLASFRWLVETDPATGLARWRDGFKGVLDRWRAASERLGALTIERCREGGDNPDALGRSASHWGALHKEVAFLDLMAKPTPSPAAPSAAPRGPRPTT
jgi:hypothetical protein